MTYYALHDYDKSKRGMFVIDPADAKSWNEKGYGIHWMPQVFKDNKRDMANFVQIRYWLADIDTGDKETTLRRIACAPIQPTIIVETKRGYHIYWRAKDATLENYATIETGIAEFLCADASLTTPTHTLRVPGFYHLKDPKNPFLVKTIWKNAENVYSESQMLRVFKPKPKVEFNKKHFFNSHESSIKELIDPANWEKIWKISQISAGGRNNRLSEIAFGLMRAGADENTVMSALFDMNNSLPQPLDNRELESIVKCKFNKNFYK